MRKLVLIPALFFALCGAVFAQGTASNTPSGDDPKEKYSIFLPNVFTPNDDGVNDEFYASHTNISTFSITIFDRWGNQVFESSDVNFRWDGSANGRDLSVGTYVYVVNAASGSQKIKRSGTISLVK